MNKLSEQITAALGVGVRRIAALGGGCVGEVYRVDLADGETVVAKVDQGPHPILGREAAMLRYLAGHSQLPAPRVLFGSDRLLIMTWLPGSSSFTTAGQRHAAELLAGLHALAAPAYGFEEDTLIGGLHQPNPWTASWPDFFRDQRILAMGRQALEAGQLPPALMARLDRLAARLERWLPEGGRPALLHGDVWAGNVLAQGDRITGFVDPALYYGDPEIELAFITLFHTFGAPFFEHYAAMRPLQPGFWEERRDLYNLYPLLVHVRLFGGSYVSAVDATLRRFGI